VSWKQSWAENEGIMKIVAAVDGSEQSDAVVNEIIRRQFPPESELCVLSVVDPAYPALNSPNVGMDIQFIDTQSYDATQGAAHERARSAVDRAVAMLQATAASRHLAVTAKVLFGAPKDTILEESETFGADLIMVGSHGYGMIERVLLGSVSQSVALHAKCSVEIVRRPPTRTGKSA
jgi:nucleotide-binding universal stress UspA family protein